MSHSWPKAYEVLIAHFVCNKKESLGMFVILKVGKFPK